MFWKKTSEGDRKIFGVATIYARTHMRTSKIFFFFFFILWFMSLRAQENMENGISEALKIKIFWRSIPPDPLRGSRRPSTFHYAFVCVPKIENHAKLLWTIVSIWNL